MPSGVLLSFIVPAYNAEKFLFFSVGSAIAQKIPNSEIVIVNDASNDATENVCRHLQRRYRDYPIIYATNTKNLGGGATRNKCLELAHGEFIFNLDADNVIPKGLLAKLLDGVETLSETARSSVMITPAVIQYFQRQRVVFGTEIRKLRHKWIYESVSPTFVYLNPITPASSGNYLYAHKIAESVGGHFVDCGAYDAWSFGIRCYTAGYRYKIVKETFYLHRLHSESYWSTGQRVGANRLGLYNAVRHFEDIYSDETLKTLHPNNPHYPDDPFGCLILRHDSVTL